MRKRIRCRKCNRTYKNRSTLYRHRIKKHKKFVPNPLLRPGIRRDFYAAYYNTPIEYKRFVK